MSAITERPDGSAEFSDSSGSSLSDLSRQFIKFS
jgi:hypothetical protein